MSFLSIAGPLAGGISQGLDQASMIRARASQIQQAQFNLDQQKRQLAGQAAAFQSLLQQSQQGGPPIQQQLPQGQVGAQGAQTGQPQPMPQSPMPGQASVPNVQPQPQGSPQAGAFAGQPQMPSQQQGFMGGQDLSPQAQLNIIGRIASNIKARNPNVDDATLFEATKAQIGLLGAFSQSQKQQLVFAADTLKASVQERGQDVSRQNTQARVGAQERGQDISARNTDVRAKTSIANTNARIADADRRLTETQNAINARQANTLGDKAKKQAITQRAAMLKTELSQAKQKLAAANQSGDQGQIDQAQKAVDNAYNRILDLQTKAMGGKPTPSAGKVSGGANDPLGLNSP